MDNSRFLASLEILETLATLGPLSQVVIINRSYTVAPPAAEALPSSWPQPSPLPIVSICCFSHYLVAPVASLFCDICSTTWKC